MRRFLLASAWLLAGAGGGIPAVLAHDLWLEPATYFAARGQEVGVTLALGETGKPAEVKPLRRTDLARFVRVGARRPTQDLLGELPKDGDAPAFSFRAEGGNTLLAMERTPKRLDQGAGEFTHYLTEEGQTEALAHRARAGQGDQPGRERYRRYLKTLVQDAEPSAAPAVLYRRRIGQRLEILLENNPGRLRPGQPVLVRVLLENRPLSGVRVTALHLPRPGVPADRTLTATTDAAGRASFAPFDQGGSWLVRLVHVRPVPALPPAAAGGDDATWESFWAAYTFGVRLLPPASPSAVSTIPAHRRQD